MPRELLVVNKTDAAGDLQLARLRHLLPDAVFVSARTGDGIDRLRARIAELLPRPEVDVEVLLPYTAGVAGRPRARRGRGAGRGAHPGRHPDARPGRRRAGHRGAAVPALGRPARRRRRPRPERSRPTDGVGTLIRLLLAAALSAALLAAPAPVARCAVDDPRLAELSGLVADGDGLWAMADGGRRVQVHRLDPDGCAVRDTRTGDIDPLGPEDLARGPGRRRCGSATSATTSCGGTPSR